MKQFFFVAETPGDISTGGGSTVAGLSAGLAGLGHQTSFGRWHDAPDDAIVILDGSSVPLLDPTTPRLDRAIGFIQHTTALVDTATKPGVRAVERGVLPQLRQVIATSEPMRERLRDEFGVAERRLHVVVPGAPDVARATGSGTGCAILSIGALVPRKGHDVLLKALARLRDLDWTLTIVGDSGRYPATASALLAQANQSGISSRVRFAGTLPNAKLEDEWLHADLFALATNWEGYAISVAEALRRGIPVAVTSGGQAAGLMSAATGVVAAPGNADELSKGLRRLIFDAPLRQSISDAAYASGQALPNWHEQAAKFAAIAEAA